MFVWKAISSITLLILEMRPLVASISSMAATISASLAAAAANSRCSCPTSSLAAWVRPTFSVAMPLVVRVDVVMSSTAAACSEAPSARDRLVAAISAAPAFTWADVVASSSIAWESVFP